jgi:hypothetical protein
MSDDEIEDRNREMREKHLTEDESSGIKFDMQEALEDTGFDVDPDAPARESVDIDHEKVDFLEQSMEIVEEVDSGFEGAKEIELELRYEDARYQLAVQRQEIENGDS